ncbi:hypothetical protein CPB85DRAFT_993390 [Mucidula mucida]|nr:hypothetical protein CPB85DRAFT_993390 [Mucidula mucida]
MCMIKVYILTGQQHYYCFIPHRVSFPSRECRCPGQAPHAWVWCADAVQLCSIGRHDAQPCGSYDCAERAHERLLSATRQC